MGTTEILRLQGVGCPAQQASTIDSIYSPSAVASTYYESVAATGSAQGDAAALSATKFLHTVTAADGTKGVILPAIATADIGKIHTIISTAAAVLKIYPATGGTINGGSANAAFSSATGPATITCYATAASTWVAA